MSIDHKNSLNLSEKVEELNIPSWAKRFFILVDNPELFSLKEFQKFLDLEAKYQEWLYIAEKYYSSRTNFKRSYEFVESHPIFWRFFETENSLTLRTDNSFELLTIKSIFDGHKHTWEIKVKNEIENKDSIYENDLTSNAHTVEDCFIHLAKKLDKHYHLDGTKTSVHETS